MTDYTAQIAQAEKKYGLPPGILQGQLVVESGGDPTAVSNKGALGLMQIMPDTARRYGVDPNNPSSAIDGAARIMRDNLKAAKGDPTLALRFYQGGMDKSHWGKQNAAYAGKVYSAMPGDSGDLTAMGFSTPSQPQAANDDSADLGAAGLSSVPDKTLTDAQALINSYSGGPQPAKMDAIQKGVQPFLRAGDKQGAIDYLVSHGQRPKDTQQIDAAIAQYAKGGNAPVAVVNVDTHPLKPSDSTLENLKLGADQGIQDVVGSIGKGAQWLEGKVPALKSLDEGVGNLLGTQTADQAAAQYDRNNALFKATAGQTTAGQIGRIGGNILMSAPVMGVAGAAAEPVVAGTLGSGAADFLAGRTASGLLARGGSLAANGGLQGVSAAALTSAASEQPLSQQLETGGLLGAALGPAGGLVGAGASGLKNAVIPVTDTARAALAQKAIAAGIPIRPGQIADSSFLKTTDNMLRQIAGSGMDEKNATQQRAFTKAVGRTFGADSDTLSPQVMQNAKDRIGDVYDTVGARTNLDLNPENGSTFLNNISDVVSRANLGPQNAGRAQALVDEVLAKVKPDGTMSGKDFKTLTSRGSMLSSAAASPDREYGSVAKEIRDSLNTELEKAATPQDAAALAKANLQWKNMRTVERLVANSPDGQVNPALLQRPVTTSFKNRAYTGAGDLGDLADIGQIFLKPTRDSGTAQNAEKLRLFNLSGHAALGLAGASLGHAAGADLLMTGMSGLAGYAATSGIAKGATKVFSSPALTNRLINAALKGDDLPVASRVPRNFAPIAYVTGNDLVRRTALGGS